MGDNQEQFKSKEREIPVFTVFKNNCILKNIYLLDNPPNNVDQDSEVEETLVVGRHPDCSIKLEHPSVSRFHLRITLKPSSRSLFVTDLSSVHGTWVLGKKIEAGFSMKLNEGDTLQLGTSSRLYKLNWIPLSRAYDIDNPFVPQLDATDIVEEDTEGEAFQDENILSCLSDQVQILSDTMEGQELQHSDENPAFSIRKMSSSGSLIPENLCHSLFIDKSMEANEIYIQDNEILSKRQYQFDKEHDALGALCPSLVSQKQSETKNMKTPGMKQEKRLGLSIWSRRGKPKRVQIENCHTVSILKDTFAGPDHEEEEIFTPDKENSSHVKSLVYENCHTVSILKDTFAGPDHEEEEIFTPDKENLSPFSLVVGSWKSKSEKNHESILKTPMSSNSSHVKSLVHDNYHETGSDHEEEEIFTPEKENLSPFSLVVGSWKSKSEKNRESILKTPLSSNSLHVKSLVHDNYHAESVSKDESAGADHEEEIFTPGKENHSPFPLVVGPWKSKGEKNHGSILKTPLSSVNQDEDIFTPDNENMTANARCLRSMKKMEIIEVKHPLTSHRPSSLNKAVNCNLYQEVDNFSASDVESKSQKVLTTSHACLKKKLSILKSRGDRNPFQPLYMKFNCNDCGNSKPSTCEAISRGCRSTNYPKSEEASILPKNSTSKEKKRWTIIADTASLLNINSRKELQLLRGLKGTSLIVPRIVVRELDCMLRRGGFLRRTGRVSAALQWIEDCMENTKWWIHVQNSAEEGMLIPPTPPAAASPHWFNEDKNALSIGSIPISPYSLHEIFTPTTENHILDSALFFKRIKNNEELVLLTDDVTLKIKAMAEGVICETAEEFRRSLVNPFSERFLYAESSPRGSTWSVVDDAILKERYYPSPSKKLSKSRGSVKGLKILLHNSNFSRSVLVL